jgi:hypothetical protein
VDSSGSVTLTTGQRLEVFLHGTPESLWTPPAADGLALEPAASGKRTLALGVTGAAFLATRSGSSSVTSTRRVCPVATPGQAACQAMQSFELTVVVR